MTKQDSDYSAYLASDCWKCPVSPNGAHHWIEKNVDGKHSGLFYCKYCFDVNYFPIAYAGTTKGDYTTLPIIRRNPTREFNPVPMKEHIKRSYER